MARDYKAIRGYKPEDEEDEDKAYPDAPGNKPFDATSTSSYSAPKISAPTKLKNMQYWKDRSGIAPKSALPFSDLSRATAPRNPQSQDATNVVPGKNEELIALLRQEDENGAKLKQELDNRNPTEEEGLV